MVQLFVGDRDIEPIEYADASHLLVFWNSIDHKQLGRIFARFDRFSGSDASVDARFAAAWDCAHAFWRTEFAASIALQAAGHNYSKDNPRRYQDQAGRSWLHLNAVLAAHPIDAERPALIDFIKHLVADRSMLNCRTCDGATPLKVHVGASFDLHDEVRLSAWLMLLRDAGVDIEVYGRSEIDLWIPWRDPRVSCNGGPDSYVWLPCDGDPDSYVVMESFTYGHSPTDWCPVFRRVRVVEVYRTRPPPGFWPNEAIRDTNSEWYLGCSPGREESLLYLSLERVVSIASKPYKAGTLNPCQEQGDMGAQELQRSQDDTGCIALAMARQPPVGLRSRSQSQPPLGRTARHQATPTYSLSSGYSYPAHLCNLGNGRRLTNIDATHNRLSLPQYAQDALCVWNHGRLAFVENSSPYSKPKFYLPVDRVQPARDWTQRMIFCHGLLYPSNIPQLQPL